MPTLPPWLDLEDGLADFLPYLRRHWPHYTKVTLTYNLAFEVTRDVELAGLTYTDTWDGSASGTFTWDRQSSGDEISEQPLTTDDFYFSLRIEALTGATDPWAASAILHHATLSASSPITTTSAIVQVLHTYNAETDTVDTTTTYGDITVQVPSAGLIGVWESGDGQWYGRLAQPGGGSAGPALDVSATGPGLPGAIPTQEVDQAYLIQDDPEAPSVPPAGRDITFSWDGTTDITDVWTGLLSISATITLSTTP